MADLGIQRGKTHFQWLLQNAKSTIQMGKNALQKKKEKIMKPQKRQTGRTEITINKYKFQAQT